MPLLNTPLRIGNLTAKNRVVMAPMASNLVSTEGEVTEALIEHLERRAAGGCGIVMVESAAIEPRLGRADERNLRMDSDACIAGLTRIADALHRQQCLAISQLWHAGPRAKVPPGERPVSPSGVSVLPLPPLRELSVEEIRELVRGFGECAGRAVRAGFDGIEVHAAHGYLLHHFIDARTNQRRDEYGGSLEGRYRVLAEIRREIRAGNPDVPVVIRLSLSPEDPLPEIAAHLEGIEYDGIDVRTGFSSMPVIPAPPRYTLGLAASIKRGTSLPVMAGGRIITPEEAEEALGAGVVDAIVLGRALLADADWPKKAFAGMPIRDCKYDCCPSCYDVFKQGERLRCVFYS